MWNILILIPARGGSKGIPGKNRRLLGGKPLIARTIEQALKLRREAKGERRKHTIKRIIVSTDDEKIAAVAKKYGAEVPFMRPKSLAGDKTPMVDVVLHALKTLKREGENYDVVVLLQPTSPFRTAEDIEKCLKLFEIKKYHSVVSLCEVKENPGWMLGVNNSNNKAVPLMKNVFFGVTRRQDLPKYYHENSAVYIIRVSSLQKFSKKFKIYGKSIGAYIMPTERSLDIDTGEDLKLARKKWREIMG